MLVSDACSFASSLTGGKKDGQDDGKNEDDDAAEDGGEEQEEDQKDGEEQDGGAGAGGGRSKVAEYEERIERETSTLDTVAETLCALLVSHKQQYLSSLQRYLPELIEMVTFLRSSSLLFFSRSAT
jgi:hypothetical protein